MSALGTIAAIWLGVGFAILMAVLLSLRSEPTAHGQIVGRQMGCLLLFLWPVALAYLVILSPILLRRWWLERRA